MMFNILRVIIFWEKYVIILFGKKTQIIQTYIQHKNLIQTKSEALE